MLEDRTIDVTWNNNANKRYLSCILVYTNDIKNHIGEKIALQLELRANAMLKKTRLLEGSTKKRPK